MSEEDRNEILHTFQDVTAMQDTAECIAILESQNWDLMASISSHLRQHECEETEMTSSSVPIDEDVELTSTSGLSDTSSVFTPRMHFSSHDRGRLLVFFVEYRDRSTTLSLNDGLTVMDIKKKLSTEFGVPTSDIQLSGFKGGFVTDDTLLRRLCLPLETFLVMVTPGSAQFSQHHSSSIPEDYKLLVRDVKCNKELNLTFAPHKTVKDVKMDCSQLFNIPVRFQHWEGWPTSATADDSMSLGDVFGSKINNNLWIRKDESQSSSSRIPSVSNVITLSDSDSGDEAFLDTIDLTDVHRNDSSQPLLPDSFSDIAAASQHFSRVFINRYGNMHPLFYVGGLDEVVKDALMVKARERKLLALYIHHDKARFGHLFCSQVLCQFPIIDFFAQNCLLWGWDLTVSKHRDWFFSQCRVLLGASVAMTLSDLDVSKLPALVLVSKSRGSCEVTNVITEVFTVEEMLPQLLSTLDMFLECKSSDSVDELEREARESVLREQDEAYQRSLQEDRAKEAARQAVEDKEKKAKQHAARKERDELKMAEVENKKKEEERLYAAKSIPLEPPKDGSEPQVIIRFRCPESTTMQHRFYATDTLELVARFLASKGYPSREYKILSSFPRRDLSSLEQSTSLADSGFHKQDTLIIEER